MINRETLAEVKFVNNSGQKESGGEKQPKERMFQFWKLKMNLHKKSNGNIFYLMATIFLESLWQITIKWASFQYKYTFSMILQFK